MGVPKAPNSGEASENALRRNEAKDLLLYEPGHRGHLRLLFRTAVTPLPLSLGKDGKGDEAPMRVWVAR